MESRGHADRSRAGGWTSVALPRLAFAVLASVAALLTPDLPAAAAEPGIVRIAYVAQQVDRPPPLSLLEPILTDAGVQGARLGIADNNTTGRFTKQSFELEEVFVPQDGDPGAAFKELLAKGYDIFVVDLPAAALLAVADLPETTGALIFNAGANDDVLRNEKCRPNVLHTAPSRAMLADALAQYLIWKKWRRWFLLRGVNEPDRKFAAAVRRAAKRFGAKIVEEREYAFKAGSRRTDTGHVLVQKQIPVLTQGVDYDVLVVADESEAFGEYLIYRTWEPKVVAGTHGLVPTDWSRVHEQWGGTQLQRRFGKIAHRWMTPRDYAAWVAVRGVGEAATRTRSSDVKEIGAYLRSDKFLLAAFKGKGLTFRPWNGQLRQPILLAGPRTLVSVSPQQGFLHQFNEMDTLGYDRPESKCKLD